MTDQVSLDSAKQEAATTHVVEGGDAVTSSAQGSSSLGAAQKSMFWGQEAGPASMGDSSFHLFTTISEALAHEAALIATFESEINAALEDFTGTEHENKLKMENIQHALDRVDRSDAAAAVKVTQHKVFQMMEGLGLAKRTQHTLGTASSTDSASASSTTSGGSAASASTPSATSNNSAPTATSGPREY